MVPQRGELVSAIICKMQIEVLPSTCVVQMEIGFLENSSIAISVPDGVPGPSMHLTLGSQQVNICQAWLLKQNSICGGKGTLFLSVKWVLRTSAQSHRQ